MSKSPHSARPAPDLDPVVAAIREAAQRLGFVRVGFFPVEKFADGAEALRDWIARGFQGEMNYLAQGTDRADPRTLLSEARTVIAVALPYAHPDRGLVALRRSESGERVAGLNGRIADYALGKDYHEVLHVKLKRLAEACSSALGRPVLRRICVDTAPLLEREASRRAGVGFIGKNTMSIVPGVGSRVLLGELLTDVELSASEPIDGGCGRCRACLDACPTGAFVGPFVLDARRCISYLTIELKGSIPREFRRKIGDRVFGCDICQDVCPFNASAHPVEPSPDLAPRDDLLAPDLISLLELSSSGYRRLTRHSPLRRAKNRARLARNAAVALGNSGDPRAVPPLAHALRTHKSALVRSHAAWALGELGGSAATAALEDAASNDPDESVRDEARSALPEARARGPSAFGEGT